jgi:predicted dehydrogenase
MKISSKFPAVFSFLMTAFFSEGCGPEPKQEAVAEKPVKLITLDPGHFHAALVQKKIYPDIDSAVYVYAPKGQELDAHLQLVKQYNERKDDPSNWDEKVYTGPDYAEKMIQEKKGNVVVIAGNNRLKTEYILNSVKAGFNVLADKPMIIKGDAFGTLLESFSTAEKNKVLLYDIMTERSEITNILQRELAQTEIFGELKKGTPADPGVMMESVHYFYKYVSGNVLTRPTWFFDPAQQGEAIPDVGTHLVDLVQWECFPEQKLDYQKDIQVISARTWPTPVTLSQFKSITKKDSFPSFLKNDIRKDSILDANSNGEVVYTIRGVHAKVIARWDFQAVEGGDTHYSILKGSKSDLVIKQGKEEGYKPALYIIPAKGTDTAAFAGALKKVFESLAAKYPGLSVEKTAKAYTVKIPESFKVGHEAHFAQVMERYLDYLKNKNMPAWEVPNMLAKYYVTTRAIELSAKGSAGK